jgi:hypothetical protein
MDRFWSKVDKSEDCWEWTAAKTSKGYGKFSLPEAGKWALAHRYAYELSGADISDMCVLHHCDNPACVNPDHLFLGTRADNAADRDRKGRGATKLTADDVRSIRNMGGKATQRKIAEKYGVSQSIVQRILAGKIWTRV